MYETLFIIGIVCATLAGAFLIATIVMFFGFNIPALRKDMNGLLEQKQIEEIRRNSNASTNQRGKINVFEELEKNAKFKKANTYNTSDKLAAVPLAQSNSNIGTSILNNPVESVNPNFIIEKNIMFVSTNEVM